MKSAILKKVYARQDASTASRKILIRESGTFLNITGMKYGEPYRGNTLWYVDDKNQHYTSSAIDLNLQNNRLSSIVDFPSLWKLASKKPLKIGIYDSGITKDSPQFGSRVVQLNHDNSTIVNRHADYMATIIAGSDIAKGYVGFLPNAQLYSYQAAENGTTIRLSDLKTAMKMFLDSDIDILNISMRSNDENANYENDTEFHSLVTEYNKRNIFINCCAGQDFEKDDAFFCYPSRAAGVFSIAGNYGIGQPSTTLYYRTNLWAGVKMLAASDEIYTPPFYSEFGIAETVGTSVSTAVVTGVLALLKIKFSQASPPVSLPRFIDDQIALMPDFPIDADTQQFVHAESFKTLDFSILHKILNS